MKIGILTLPLHTNYGGILQAYALQTVLERMGHDAFVLSIKRNSKLQIALYPIIVCWRLYRKFIIHTNNEIFVEHLNAVRSKNIISFVNNRIHIYKVNSFFSLKENDFSCYIVGSDQVWRKSMFKQIENAYLKFTNGWNVKRIAYAVSFGIDTWDYSEAQTNNCKKLANLFDAISVREQSGVRLCFKNFSILAKQVLDPTLLLSRLDYESLIDDVDNYYEHNNLFSYVIMPNEKTNEIESKMVSKFGCKHSKIILKSDKISPYPSISSWLGHIKNSDYVLTDSFHGIVFSIIFNKPFAILINRAGGITRIDSLMNMFGIHDRYVSNIDDLDMFKMNDINWNLVNEKLNALRVDSKNFLEKNLKAKK